MRLRSFIAITLTVLFIFVAEDADAQRRNKYQKRKAKNRAISHYRGGRVSASRFRPYSFVGASVNALNYFGDLAPVNKAASTDISFTRPGFGLFYGHKFHHSMSYRVAFNYGRLTGDDITSDPTTAGDAPRYMRNLSFRNDIKELSATLQIDFLPNYGGPQSRMLLNGYAFFGAAVFHHEPKALVPDFEYQSDVSGSAPVATAVPQAGEWVKLRELGTEGQNFGQGVKYSPWQFAIPFGLGGEVFINQNLNIGLEVGVRKLFFDYIDDVSGNYVDLDLFTDPLGRILSDRSLEATGAISGDTRDVSIANPRIQNYGGQSYWVSGALGSGQSASDGVPSKRGNAGDKDVYFMTRIRVVYILGNSGRAKYR